MANFNARLALTFFIDVELEGKGEREALASIPSVLRFAEFDGENASVQVIKIIQDHPENF